MSCGNMVKHLLLKFHCYLLCNLSVSVSRVHAYMELLQVVTSCMREQHVICQKQHAFFSYVKCASGFQGTRLVMKITTNSLLCFLSIDFCFNHVPCIGLSCLLLNHAPFKQDELDGKLNHNPLGCSLSHAMSKRDWCVGPETFSPQLKNH